MMKTKRFRLRQEFWLDLHKPDEAELADTIGDLKARRTFVTTVRDGIRLICDLRAGRLDVLFELFPWVRAEFLEYMASLQLQPQRQDSELRQRLERMEKLLLEQGNVPISSTASGPKPLAAPQPVSPETDSADDDLLVVKKAQSDGSSARNFLEAAFNLIQ